MIGAGGGGNRDVDGCCLSRTASKLHLMMGLGRTTTSVRESAGARSSVGALLERLAGLALAPPRLVQRRLPRPRHLLERRRRLRLRRRPPQK